MKKKGMPRLRSAMTFNGVESADIAKRWRRSSGYISDRLTEKKEFSIQEAYDLCDFLGIPLEKLREYFPQKDRKEWLKHDQT